MKENYNKIDVVIHILCLLFVFSSPIIFKDSGDVLDISKYFRGSTVPLCAVVLFYLNYFWLIEHTFFSSRKWRFLFYNILAVIIALYLQHFIHRHLIPEPLPSGLTDVSIIPEFLLRRSIFFFIRCLFIFSFAIILSLALRLIKHLRKAEAAMHEAEFFPLKSQFGPHFFLNTLNNIYSLTFFDVAKAQQAIMQLSQLLRYILYEDASKPSSLKKLLDFIEQYILLMKLRHNDQVEVKLTTDIASENTTYLVPFIFITIVENAFKHGISATEHSFIHIDVKSTLQGEVTLRVENTNHPVEKKSNNSQGGIGLKLIRRRLEYCYRDNYTWTYGPSPDGKTYTSEITITIPH